MNPEQYIKIHDLWDIDKLKQHAQHNSVYVIESHKYPGVVMLHYQDACQYDNLWNTFNRMCRGLILDMKNHKVLAYPFDKFYNVGEQPETKYEILSTLGEFQTSEKLDGSFIIAFIDPNTDKLVFTTKGSFDSEHGEYVNSLQFTENQLKQLRGYALFGTLTFELIAKPFQIVVDYKKKGYKEGLYLIGYRDNVSHKLATFDQLKTIAADLSLPTFKTYSFNSLDELIENTKNLSVLDEGYVIRFKHDLMVKIKGNAYLAAHRFISHLSDRNILEAVADGTASTLVDLAPEEYRNDVVDKINYFQKRVVELTNSCYDWYSKAPFDGSRKDFALWVNNIVPGHFKGFMYQLYDQKPIDRKQVFRVLEDLDHIDGKTKI